MGILLALVISFVAGIASTVTVNVLTRAWARAGIRWRVLLWARNSRAPRLEA